MREHRYIKLATTEAESNFVCYKIFHRAAISNRNQATEILMKKRVYLGLSILELSKILKYEFWYNYVKPKYGEKAKLCFTDTESFIVCIKTEDIYKDIPEDVETRPNTSNYQLDRSLPKGNNKKAIGLIKDELFGKIMIKVVGLRANSFSYLIDDGSEDKKAKT